MKLASTNRILLRAAAQIHERLKATSCHDVPQLPVSPWQDLVATQARLKLAVDRAWRGAAQQIRAELRSSVSYFMRRLDDCLGHDQASRDPAHICSAREIYQDLLALYEEFEEVKIDLESQLLTAVTDSIVLEDTYLGRFEILLNYGALDDDPPYIVAALDTNASSVDSDVTHPHVRDQRLCEGNGRLPIRRALEQGRLVDFFVLVRQILETYNADSAYVELSQWHGRDCPDCGGRMGEDDATSCEHCDSEICRECSSSCPDCGRTCCSECRMMCPDCETDYCRECLKPCPGCGHDYCPPCLKKSLCQDCRLKENEPDDQRHKDCNLQTSSAAQATAGPQETQASLQPLCLGEALVPA